MAINIRHVANGWIVEVWREKTKREEHVFADTADMLAFVMQVTNEAAF